VALFALVMAIAIARWHVKKYSVVGGLLLVRSSLVNRSIRVVPIARITALAASQSLTQRLVGVWGLDVQSPGDRHGPAVTLACPDRIHTPCRARRGAQGPHRGFNAVTVAVGT
jgi:putative membrane protein